MFVAPTIPDERYEKEQASIAPSAPASAGGSHAGRDPGDGPNLIALGAVHRCPGSRSTPARPVRAIYEIAVYSPGDAIEGDDDDRV